MAFENSELIKSLEFLPTLMQGNDRHTYRGLLCALAGNLCDKFARNYPSFDGYCALRAMAGFFNTEFRIPNSSYINQFDSPTIAVQEADHSLQNWYKLYPTDFEALFLLAFCEYAMGNTENTETCLAQVLVSEDKGNPVDATVSFLWSILADLTNFRDWVYKEYGMSL